MIDPFYPDDDCPFGLPPEDNSLGGRLRRFHEQFDSGIRAILRDCLFRLDENLGESLVTLQILCPNEAVFKRLAKKQEKIRGTVRWIWGDSIQRVGLYVKKDGAVCEQLMVRCPRYGG